MHLQETIIYLLFAYVLLVASFGAFGRVVLK